MDFSIITLFLKEAAIIIGIPVVRSIAGWAPKALADNKIVKWEWTQLMQTVIRVGTMALFAHLGLDLAGVDNSLWFGAIGAFFADKAFSALKKTQPVRQ